jgi:hypothetical protein
MGDLIVVQTDYSFAYDVDALASPVVQKEESFNWTADKPCPWTILIDYSLVDPFASIGLQANGLISSLSAQDKGALQTSYLFDPPPFPLSDIRVPRVGGTYRLFGRQITLTLNTLPVGLGTRYILGVRAFPYQCYQSYTVTYGVFGAGKVFQIPKFATHYCLNPYSIGTTVRSASGLVLETTVDPLVNSSEYLPLSPRSFDVVLAAAGSVSFRLHG